MPPNIFLPQPPSSNHCLCPPTAANVPRSHLHRADADRQRHLDHTAAQRGGSTSRKRRCSITEIGTLAKEAPGKMMDRSGGRSAAGGSGRRTGWGGGRACYACQVVGSRQMLRIHANQILLAPLAALLVPGVQLASLGGGVEGKVGADDDACARGSPDHALHTDERRGRRQREGQALWGVLCRCRQAHSLLSVAVREQCVLACAQRSPCTGPSPPTAGALAPQHRWRCGAGSRPAWRRRRSCRCCSPCPPASALSWCPAGGWCSARRHAPWRRPPHRVPASGRAAAAAVAAPAALLLLLPRPSWPGR